MTDSIRFALVPAAATKEMRKAGREANGPDMKYQGHEINAIYAAMLAASPGNDLLERIVNALNTAKFVLGTEGFDDDYDKIGSILNELGAGHHG
jgi:hypothetical protein